MWSDSDLLEHVKCVHDGSTMQACRNEREPEQTLIPLTRYSKSRTAFGTGRRRQFVANHNDETIWSDDLVTTILGKTRTMNHKATATFSEQYNIAGCFHHSVQGRAAPVTIAAWSLQTLRTNLNVIDVIDQIVRHRMIASRLIRLGRELVAQARASARY